MVEVMACGMPVLGFRHGSVAEVIEDGLTGFVVESFDDALRAVEQLGTIDRRVVRMSFERRFTARRMAEDYVRVYEGLLTLGCSAPSATKDDGTMPLGLLFGKQGEVPLRRAPEAAWK